MDVFPAAGGRLFVSLTVTVCPCVTIIVGPGTCMVGHVAPVRAGAKPVGAILQPYPQE
jgi:hypothetical protein